MAKTTIKAAKRPRNVPYEIKIAKLISCCNAKKNIKKNQDHVKAGNPIIKEEKYIKCLTNNVSKIIYTDFPELPLKFKKILGKRVDEFNLRIRNMFAELYCKSDGSPCKTIMDSRAIGNIENISEELLQTPFMNMEECR